jgi:hypothetical protein
MSIFFQAWNFFKSRYPDFQERYSAGVLMNNLCKGVTESFVSLVS